MSLTGDWDIEIDTPMGVQKATLSIAVQGDALTGSYASPFGTSDIEGRVSGETATWPVKLRAPFPMTLNFTATAVGDTLSGKVKAGPMGTSAFKGTRAS